MSKKNVKIKFLLPWLVAVGFALLFFGTVIFFQQKSYIPPTKSPLSGSIQEGIKETAVDEKKETDKVLVSRVIDGDTVELSDGTRVRYIGVDTPEPGQCFGEAATEANAKLIENQKVRLEMDIEKQDKYGRTLAYVWRDTKLINEELVREGFATVTTYAPNVKYVERFLAAQKEARDAERGIWKSGICSESKPTTSPQVQSSQTECTIKGNISSSGEKIYHMPGQRYYEQTKIEENKGERWFCSENEAIDSGWRKSKV
ncbi:MAG: thermonuclease family protein [bacterium]|nr:thermonuclease family protein [bacterium]